MTFSRYATRRCLLGFTRWEPQDNVIAYCERGTPEEDPRLVLTVVRDGLGYQYRARLRRPMSRALFRWAHGRTYIERMETLQCLALW